MNSRKIYFEDHGQDFLWFIVDEAGVVQDAGPFQGSLWAGKTGYIEPINGRDHFVIVKSKQTHTPIIYPVEKVEVIQ